MTRTLLILAILTLNCFQGSAQASEVKFDRMRISHNGDSLIKQEYELILSSRKVYFITASASYLHIKGGKYRTRVKFGRTKRHEIFNLVDRLAWANLKQTDDNGIKNKYFVVEIYSKDNLVSNYTIADKLLPADFKELYDALCGK